MGVLSRFRDIMAANVNALLDKAENPQKMIDQYLRDLEGDLAKVKAETASMMAEEKAAKRDLDECNEEIGKMADYAKRAVAAGNDNEAKQFLQKKSELSGRQETLQKKYDIAVSNSAQMREMHDKLESDIASLKGRRETLKAKAQIAETQAKMNKMGSGSSQAGATMAAFDRMEDKINKMLDEQDAMEELNKGQTDSTEELMKKYDRESKESDVDAELAALKAEMGL
ncbi:MAG: PspA/IM30 family protein [Lachnospiraceae bacterium]|jgi:phage shock protein A|nr:PspA/IM30 family protein [Lachnospiraceae bacterium]